MYGAWTTFILVFRPLERIRLENESLGLLALSLSSGIPLARAAGMAAEGMPWEPYRRAIQALSHRLSAGEPLRKALSCPDCGGLPHGVMAILASDLSDREKGAVLRLRFSKARLGVFRGFMILAYPAAELAIAGLVALSLCLFVLPQFKEIFFGLRIPLPPLTQALMGFSDLLSVWGIIGVPLAVFGGLGILGVLLSGVARNAVCGWLGIDRGNLAEVFRIFAEIPPDRLEWFLETLPHPVILPWASAMLDDLREGLGTGYPLDAILLRHGLDPHAAWMIRLAVEGKATRENFLLAAELIDARSEGAVGRLVIAVETVLPLALSLFVGVLAFGVFLPMISLLERI